jgi:hypothetical protein
MRDECVTEYACKAVPRSPVKELGQIWQHALGMTL